jgi:hypothetical protein
VAPEALAAQAARQVEAAAVAAEERIRVERAAQVVAGSVG